MSVAKQESFKEVQFGIGASVVLLSFIMLFLTLFLGYALYRNSQPVWPPMGITGLPLKLPSIATAIILFSSISFHLFSVTKRKVFYVLTGFLAISFLVNQLMLWDHLKTVGILASSGIYGSLLYGFTWIHAAHILLGLLALLWVYPSEKRLKNEEVHSIHTKAALKFWHLLGFVWVIMYIALFVY